MTEIHLIAADLDGTLLDPDGALSPRTLAALRAAHAAGVVTVLATARRFTGAEPIARAIGYARNQRVALRRFLGDERLPIHNNASELALRREVVGRKNWLFLGSDEAGGVNATFVTLLASCRLHGLEPWSYLRNLFCLLPAWPQTRVLELAPAYWKQTLEQKDTQQRLAANVYRAITLQSPPAHSPNK